MSNNNNKANVSRPTPPVNPNQPAAVESDRQAATQASATSQTSSKDEQSTPVEEEASLMMIAAQQYGGSLSQLSANLSKEGYEVGAVLAKNIYGDGLTAGLLQGQADVINSIPERLLAIQASKIKERIENFTVTTASAVGGISPSRNTLDLSNHF